MAQAAELLAELDRRGVRVEVSGDRLRLAPPSLVDRALLDDVRQHKAELLAAVAATRPAPRPRDAATLAMMRDLEACGFGLLESPPLGDWVLIVVDEAVDVPAALRVQFVSYTLAELRAIGRGIRTRDDLRALHAAKRAMLGTFGGGSIETVDRLEGGGAPPLRPDEMGAPPAHPGESDERKGRR